MFSELASNELAALNSDIGRSVRYKLRNALLYFNRRSKIDPSNDVTVVPLISSLLIDIGHSFIPPSRRAASNALVDVMARTHHPLILALLSALALASFALYARDSSVVDLTADNFASLVIPTPKVWLVEFYAPWCTPSSSFSIPRSKQSSNGTYESLGGHCKNFAKDYAKAAENLQGIVNVGAVDCDADKVPFPRRTRLVREYILMTCRTNPCVALLASRVSPQ